MNLFKYEKRHKFHVSICVFNLPVFAGIIFVTYACHFEYRLNWHAKSLLSKSIAKIDTLNMQKKAVSKFADLVVSTKTNRHSC